MLESNPSILCAARDSSSASNEQTMARSVREETVHRQRAANDVQPFNKADAGSAEACIDLQQLQLSHRNERQTGQAYFKATRQHEDGDIADRKGVRDSSSF